MNLNFLKCFVSVVAVLSSAQLSASPLPDWVSSYNMNGSCYCTPDIHSSLKNKIVSTPIGGQSIEQVCAKVGKGSGLELENGVFNFPAYHDAQCGNGPASRIPSEGCEGRVEVDGSTCTGKGPKWDLQAAYTRAAAKKQSTNSQATEKSTAEAVAAEDAEGKSVPVMTVVSEKVIKNTEPAKPVAQAVIVEEDSAAEAVLAKKLAEAARNRAESESENRIATTAMSDSDDAAEARLARELAAGVQSEPAREALALQTRPEILPDAVPIDSDTSIDDSVTESGAAEKMEAITARTNPAVTESTSSTAVRVPAIVGVARKTSGYVELAPVSYDFGGAGALLAGTVTIASNWHLTGRAAVVEEYSEAMIGFRKSLVSRALGGGEVNFLAGIEYGKFDLSITELTDSGVVLGSSFGYNIAPRTKLSAGLEYSSFFDGDPSAFGQVLYRVVNNLDFSSRLEGGDNANLSLGIRYHY